MEGEWDLDCKRKPHSLIWRRIPALNVPRSMTEHPANNTSTNTAITDHTVLREVVFPVIKIRAEAQLTWTSTISNIHPNLVLSMYLSLISLLLL